MQAALSICWIKAEMSLNLFLHFGHLNSFASCAAEFKWSLNEERDENILWQRKHAYALPLNELGEAT